MPRFTKQSLLKLQKDLKTDDAIGKKFGMTRQAVHQWRMKLGIKPDETRNKERNKEIVSLYKKGVPGNKIAKKVGLSISQMYRIIRGHK